MALCRRDSRKHSKHNVQRAISHLMTCLDRADLFQCLVTWQWLSAISMEPLVSYHKDIRADSIEEETGKMEIR